MAEPDELAPTAGESGMDYGEHEKTYTFFLNLMKWQIIAAVGVLLFLAIFVA